MTVQLMFFTLKAVERASEGSVLTCGDADWAGDADRFSVSGTASWVKGRLGWYPIPAMNKKQSTIAISSGEAELVAAPSELAKAWVHDSSGTGCESLETMQRRRAQHRSRSYVVIPLQL